MSHEQTIAIAYRMNLEGITAYIPYKPPLTKKKLVAFEGLFHHKLDTLQTERKITFNRRRILGWKTKDVVISWPEDKNDMASYQEHGAGGADFARNIFVLNVSPN